VLRAIFIAQEELARIHTQQNLLVSDKIKYLSQHNAIAAMEMQSLVGEWCIPGVAVVVYLDLLWLACVGVRG
jgi:hypothetical protein